MPAKKINLFAPNNLPIVGALTVSNSIRALEFYYDNVTLLMDFIVSQFGANIIEQDGEMVLVDTAGNQWLANDVAVHSITHT